ncbi:hypothetical protein D3C76_1279140 [compost metagenome]
MPLVGVTDGDAVVGEGPKLFDQTVVQLLLPLTSEETLGFFAIVCKLGAVTPFGVQGIGERNFFRLAGIPAIFSEPDFFNRRFASKRRKWRANLCVGHGDASKLSG